MSGRWIRDAGPIVMPGVYRRDYDSDVLGEIDGSTRQGFHWRLISRNTGKIIVHGFHDTLSEALREADMYFELSKQQKKPTGGGYKYSTLSEFLYPKRKNPGWKAHVYRTFDRKAKKWSKQFASGEYAVVLCSEQFLCEWGIFPSKDSQREIVGGKSKSAGGAIDAIEKYMAKHKKNPSNGFPGHHPYGGHSIEQLRKLHSELLRRGERREAAEVAAEIRSRAKNRKNPTLMVMNPKRRRNHININVHQVDLEDRRRPGKGRSSRYKPGWRGNPGGGGSAEAMYRRFHGTRPHSRIAVDVPPGSPKGLIVLGRLKDISYKVPGHSAKAHPRNIPFLHRSGPGNVVLTDPSGKYLIIGKTRKSRMRVKADGIHN